MKVSPRLIEFLIFAGLWWIWKDFVGWSKKEAVEEKIEKEEEPQFIEEDDFGVFGGDEEVDVFGGKR